MKRALLGSTSLLAVGAAATSVAQAQIELGLSGYMYQYGIYVDQDEGPLGQDFDGTHTYPDAEVHFVGRTTLDNGITLGVNIQLEGNTSGDQIDESYLFAEGSFGRVLVGSENSAQYLTQNIAPDVGSPINSGDQTAWLSYAGVGGGTGVFRGAFGGTVVEVNRSNDVRRLTYFTPRFFGFQFGASYAPDEQEDVNGPIDRDGRAGAQQHDTFNLAADFVDSFGGFDIGVNVGYGQGELDDATTSDVDDPSAWNVGVNLGYGDFVIGGGYAQTLNDTALGDQTGWDLGIGYSTGPWGFSLAWFHGERDGARTQTGTGTLLEAEQDLVYLSGDYSLGPGINVIGTLGFAEVEDESGLGEDNDAWYVVVGPKLKF